MKKLGSILLLITRKNPLMAVLSCVLGTLAILFAASLFALAAFLISLTALRPDFDVIAIPVVGVRFFGIGRAAFRYLERLVSHDTTFRVLRDLRVYIYNHIEPRLPDFRPSARRGGFISEMVSDVENLQDAFLRIAYPSMVAFLALLTGFILLFIFHPMYAWVFLTIFIAASFIAPLVLRAVSKGALKAAAEIKRRMFNEFIEFTYGLTEIVINLREHSWKERFDEILQEDFKAGRKIAIQGAAASAASVFFPGLSLFACLVVSCWLVSNEVLAPVLLAVAPLAASAIFEAALPLFSIAPRIEKASFSADRIFNVTESSLRLVNEASGRQSKAKTPFGNEIRIRNLGFRYSDAYTVIDNFSMSLKRGEIKALIGASGSGKSTLVNLILGFIDGYQGTIEIDSVDLKTMNKEKLMQYFSVVDQKPFLFNTTIRENLKMANPEAGEDEIIKALKRANAYNFVADSSNGLDTLVSEMGANLSGGELQRLSIARSLLKDSPFYIFDEPTASLDTLNAKHIMDLIKELSGNKGVLLITHRREMLAIADDVVSLGL